MSQENCSLGTAMRVTFESVKEWDDAQGRWGDGEGTLGGEFGWDAGMTFVQHENFGEPGRMSLEA
jgi:hypothetical protein